MTVFLPFTCLFFSLYMQTEYMQICHQTAKKVTCNIILVRDSALKHIKWLLSDYLKLSLLFSSPKYLFGPSAFQVSITSTGSDANEGDDITLTCVHDLPKLNLTLEWKKDEEEIKQNHNESKLALTRVRRSHAGQYICYVNSSCGNYESLPHKVTVNGK